MPLYNNPEELLQDAIKKGLVNIEYCVIETNQATIHVPHSLHILDEVKWSDFLKHIVSNSDCKQEIDYAENALKVFYRYQKEFIASNATVISIDDIINLTITLDRCESVDEFLSLLNIVKEEKKIKKKNKSTLRWKKPVFVNDFYRYHSYDTDWYIQRQLIFKASGGIMYYYSIFNSSSNEIARFDKLKDAKKRITDFIKKFA
jgi:hypothetical protein